MPLEFVLGIIAVSLFVIGLLYAYIIYHHPVDRTYIEVIIGVGFTISGEMLATYAVLKHYGLLATLWWIIPFPAAAFILTGASMSAFQEYKYRQERRKAREVERKFNGEF